MRSAGESKHHADSFASSLREGIDRFNRGEFWEAHEAWEKYWLVASGREKVFLQGLIQLTAAFHLLERGRTRGALRLFDRAREKLQTFPDRAFQVDRSGAESVAESCRRSGEFDQEQAPFLRVSP